MIDIESLEKKYVAEYGLEGCSSAELERIEFVLHVELPADFKKIAQFYSGGLIGGISHYEIASAGEATNVVHETIRIRTAIGLDRKFVVLAEPSGSIIVLNTSGKPSVIWCDAVDAENINSLKFNSQPDVWDSYSDFFSYLLEQEEFE